MEINSKKVFKTLSLNKIWTPIVLGLAITGYLFVSYDKLTLDNIRLISKADWRYMLLVILAIIIRDLGYIWRLRIITNNTLTWLGSLYIIMLWEFASAVTPSVAGGGFIAIFLLMKEGFKLGKALAYVMLTTILDNLFFILAASMSNCGAIFSHLTALEPKIGSSVKLTFLSSYSIVCIYTLLISFGLFINPRLLKWILMKCTSIRFLRKWRRATYAHSKDILLASQEFKEKKLSYWLKTFLATLFPWVARYMFLNFLIAAYFPINFSAHMAILSKQIVMWAIMLVPISPGGSGIAEFFFKQLYGNALGDYTLMLDLVWRVCTYYLYLILGVIFIPRWLKRITQKQIIASKPTD